ncbi:MAG TPA: dihydroxyacetone kinase subunit DhaL [Treponemataceae bacterium]|jgi:dihydroxyacetone kinase|nr:MAG: PTS-dependent dihydroxyacetone kinase, ADP-binding subunit DhaL [Spirochaetes bacterium ADurb.Bin269]HOC30107.1 dihydroxyacetone kinase subunit DhaL [Treponemataceae bacterium]HPX48457.1 dihydroxyacetone kinase subunit DhaL [Treponemataceae bacterium]HQL34051.1 dihydroxyacetone kinase subunit DhaL [Treponemataceae bacterium]
MNTLTTEKIIGIVDVMSDVIIRNEIPFCELDSAAGDGDFGMSVAKGFKVLKAEWKELDTEDIGAFLKSCGMIITEHCGGASGPIWGSAFRSAGKYAAGKTEVNLAEFAELMQAAVDGIQKRGGAKLGDKTLLDALIPTTESLKDSAAKGLDFKTAFDLGAKAAREGAEKTREYAASKGRASYVGDRSLSYPDAGAMALGIIFTEIAEKLTA